MREIRLSTLACGMGICFFSGQAMSAGFALIEHSASGMGSAFASGGAAAEDASTMFFNPASMSALSGRQMSAAFHYIMPQTRFSNDGSSAAFSGAPLTGNNSEGGVDAAVPNLYFTTPIGEKSHFGISVNVPFGLTTEYDDDWVGRYHAVRSHMSTVNVNPAFAFEVTPSLSLGAGVSMQYTTVELTSAVDMGTICLASFDPLTCTGLGLEPQQDDGFVEISGDSTSYGWNAGLLYTAEDTRIGLAYRSKVKHSLAGEADFTVPGNAAFLTSGGAFTDTDVEADVTLPASLSLSVFQPVNPRFSLMADATWTQWSSFEELRIVYDNPDQPESVTTEDWRDTLRMAVGGTYRLNGKLTVRAGVAADETPIPDGGHRTPRLPGNDRLWISLGGRYALNKTLWLDAGYAHLSMNDAGANNTFESDAMPHTLKGTYKASVDIVSAQLTWGF